MNQPEKLAEEDESRSLRDPQYLQKAQQAVTQMLEGSLPPANEDYGPWSGYLMGLRQVFEGHGEEFQYIVATNLFKGVPWVDTLLYSARRSDGVTWRHVLAKKFIQMKAEERMRERLARSTGDSMADEIMAMLREHDLSRTDIYRRYDRNVSAARINDALFVLERLGWARWKMVSTGGRKREVWFLPPDEEEQ